MISKLSEKAVATLFANEEFNEGDRELYIYGFFMLFSHLFFLTLTIFYGFLFGIIFESIVFHVIFTVLRGYAGGVHASTEKVCTVSTSVGLLLCVKLISGLNNLSQIFFSVIMFIISTITIIIYCPLDSPEKPLTCSEKKLYRKKTICFIMLVIVATVVSIYSDQRNVLNCCSVAVLFEGILLVLGKIKQRTMS